MKYYSLHYSSDPIIIGQAFPQSQESRKEYTTDIKSSFKIKEGYISYDFELPSPVLHNKSKLTDLISHSGFYPWILIVSEKLKLILEKNVSLNEVQFIETILISKNREYKYWSVNIFKFRYDFINFQKTKFWIDEIVKEKVEEIFFENQDSFENATSKIIPPKSISIHDLVLNSNISQDLFCLRYLANGNRFFFSEKLADEITKENCTGMEFKMLE
jgi:hypothetical protein